MADPLSVTFAALADPTRRAVLARLALGEASVTELAKPFNLTVRAVSKHVGVLERAGLVARSRDAQRRPGRLRLEPLRAVDGWLAQYRQLWEERFAAIEKVLGEIRQGTLDDPRG